MRSIFPTTPADVQGNLPLISLSNLKLCPLCDCLNSRSNQSCFVCGWQGKFVHDPKQIRSSLVILLEQCPELASSIRPEPLPQRPTFRQVSRTLFRLVFRRRLDLRA